MPTAQLRRARLPNPSLCAWGALVTPESAVVLIPNPSLCTQKVIVTPENAVVQNAAIKAVEQASKSQKAAVAGDPRAVRDWYLVWL